HGAALFGDFTHSTEAFSLEVDIANRKNLINNQYLRFEMCRHCECQPGVQPARIMLYRSIDELLELRELDNLIELPADLLFLHSQDGAVAIDVLPARKSRMKSGAPFQQRADTAVNCGRPTGRLRNP